MGVYDHIKLIFRQSYNTCLLCHPKSGIAEENSQRLSESWERECSLHPARQGEYRETFSKGRQLRPTLLL